jgi:arylsulfatase A-like enzyme
MRTHGIRDFAMPFSPEALEQTYPLLLREDGYRTGFIGKWGVGAQTDSDLELPSRNFDYWRGFEKQGEYFHTVNGKRMHLTQMMAKQASEFLEAGEPGQPFCLSISFKAPHGPWADYDPVFEDLYADAEIPTAETATPKAFESLPLFIRESLGGRRGGTDPERIRRLTRQYYRLITGVDTAVGMILKKIRDLGLDNSTVVIFTSDNGHFLHEHGLHGKWLMYEESIRVPLIIRDPRLPVDRQGVRCEEMALTVDIAPTILSLAGCEIPESMQGRDLSPLLASKDAPWRDDWFYEHTFTLSPPLLIPKSQGVRTRRWKYIRYISEQPHFEQLFDLENDPEELVNLARITAYEQTLQNLRERYEYYRRTIPNNNPDLDEYPEFKTVSLGDGPHDNACDFSGVESLGQTFHAEGTRVRSVRLATPTWMNLDAPAGLRVELYADGPGGTLLATERIPRGNIKDNKAHEVRFDCPVQKGELLYFRVRPERAVPERTLGWWAYSDDVYPGGAAYRNDKPQPYDHELRIVFKDE